MFNYKWEMKFGKMEAILSVPRNIEEILADQAVSPVEEAHFGIIQGGWINKRAKIFKKLLIERCVQDYTEWRAKRDEPSEDIYRNMRWPNFFDLDNEELIKNIPLA